MALSTFCNQLAQEHPAEAMQAAEQLNLNKADKTILPNLLQQWAGADASAALSWASTQPSGDDRNELILRIAYVQSKTDPQAAANIVITQIPPGRAQNEAAMTVISQWAGRDFTGASAWVAQFPTGVLRTRAIAELNHIAIRRLATELAQNNLQEEPITP